MALDAVLLQGCAMAPAQGGSPPTVRLMRFAPPAVLVGAYQSVETEVRLDYCREQGIDINRRLTGGGSIFFDESQVGWEIVCKFEELNLPGRPSEGLFETLSAPVVSLLQQWGLPASYRPRNDIEVGGRKICGTGGTDLGGTLLYQGTLLVDFDIEAMLRALRVPVEKLRRQEIDGMRDRVTWLTRELRRPVDYADLRQAMVTHFESELGLELVPGELTDGESAELARKLAYYESEEWIMNRGRAHSATGTSICPTEGGVVRAAVRTGTRGRHLQAAFLGGDFFVFPRRGLYDLEASLKGASINDLPHLVEAFFAEHPLDVPGVGPGGISQALAEAAERAQGGIGGLSASELNSVYAINGTLRELAQLQPSHLLLPYCAKALDCPHRRLDSCDECGQCTVGQAYKAARMAGLEIRSVTSFEHLMDTLHELRRLQAPAFVGSCCEAFYNKHRREMEEAGVPGLLVDVADSTTCYALGKSAYAYRGEFEGETDLALPLLLRLVRPSHQGSASINKPPTLTGKEARP
jgi:lipoate-protein ligase A